MGHMKEGEEDKTKSYTALIWTRKAIEKEDLTFIDNIKVRHSSAHLVVVHPNNKEWLHDDVV